jgi:hypothetical protein
MTRKTRIHIDLSDLQDMEPWQWPPNAAKLFLEILTDTNASTKDRLTAADLAGDFTVINDRLSDALLKIAGNAAEPAELRAAAAISFGAVLEQGDLFGFEDPDDVPVTEETFERIQSTLHDLYSDRSVPVLVRRRALEASIRAQQDWHPEAVAQAYSSGDRDWRLTAVFAMRWVRGFDDLILQALQSTDPEIHIEAVQAAGDREVKAAEIHLLGLIRDAATAKPLLLAAIEAVAGVAPADAATILSDLLDSDDEEIADAAEEAIDSAKVREMAQDDDADENGAAWVN